MHDGFLPLCRSHRYGRPAVGRRSDLGPVGLNYPSFRIAWPPADWRSYPSAVPLHESIAATATTSRACGAKLRVLRCNRAARTAGHPFSLPRSVGRWSGSGPASMTSSPKMGNFFFSPQHRHSKVQAVITSPDLKTFAKLLLPMYNTETIDQFYKYMKHLRSSLNILILTLIHIY